MLSKRLYKMLTILSKLSSYIGANALKFEEKTLLFSLDPTKICRRNRAFQLALYWAIASFSMVIKFKMKDDIDRYNLTLAYWLAGFLVIIQFSICRLFDDEFCKVLNATLIFVRYIHRKYFFASISKVHHIIRYFKFKFFSSELL